jgi:ABC-type dipeptide/oligopeptide/nickel transport system permease subunit
MLGEPAARGAPAAPPPGVRRGFRRNPALWTGVGLLGAIAFVAAFAPMLGPHGYADQDLTKSLQPPAWLPGGEWSHPLGTDRLGRDLLARLMVGARTSASVAALSVLLGGGLGTAMGLAAGYYGRASDRVISRLIDVQLSFPGVFLAISIMAVIGQSLPKLVLVLAFVSWVQYARIARGQTLAVKPLDFVQAARAIGASEGRIVRRHVLPAILPPLLIVGAVNVSSVILAEAALSFLGLGVQPPTPAWGSMISEARTVQSIAWWGTVFPGLAIAAVVAGANLLSDGLQRRGGRES